MYSKALSVSENVVVNVAQFLSSFELHVKHSRLLSPETQPDEIKTYPVRPELSDHRVFLPKFLSASPEASEKPQRLPIAISIHGSAWILGNPSDDDAINRYIADHAGVVVVALNYSKAPQHPFPEGLEDIIALIDAVLTDPWLPIDPERLVICGGSAGANLALAATMTPTVQGKPKGIVAICPPVDMVATKEEKMARRRRPDVPDILEQYYDTIRVTYLEKNKDVVQMNDHRLSPTFFRSRDLFPKNMYFIGFEDDLLCWEAEVMAEKLAGKAVRTKIERGWKADGVTWEMIARQKHGFALMQSETDEEKTYREAEMRGLCHRIAEWIKDLTGAPGSRFGDEQGTLTAPRNVSASE